MSTRSSFVSWTLMASLIASPLAAQSKKKADASSTAATPAPAAAAPAAAAPASGAPATAPATAPAQGAGLVTDEKSMSDAEARSHFKVGQSMYQAGRFAEAGSEWEKAYELSGRTGLLYNVYIAYRDAGDWENAARALELFLQKGEVSVEERPTLQARLDVMKRDLAAREAEEAAAAQAAAAPPPEPAAEPAAQKEESSIVPWIVGGIGGAMVLAGVATGVITLTKKSEIDEACEPTGACPPDFALEDKRDSAKTLALVTDVLLIGGGVAVATGVLLGFLLDGKPEGAVDTGSLDCNGRGCTATLYGHF